MRRVRDPVHGVAVSEAEALGLDPDAFRAFFEEALPKVYGYLLHRCGGAVPVAEDLTQETFLAAAAELEEGPATGGAHPVGLRNRPAQAARPLP